jgi:hypothetical protein
MVCDYVKDMRVSERLSIITELLAINLITREDALEIFNYSSEQLRNIRAVKEFEKSALGKELQ